MVLTLTSNVWVKLIKPKFGYTFSISFDSSHTQWVCHNNMLSKYVWPTTTLNRIQVYLHCIFNSVYTLVCEVFFGKLVMKASVSSCFMDHRLLFALRVIFNSLFEFCHSTEVLTSFSIRKFYSVRLTTVTILMQSPCNTLNTFWMFFCGTKVTSSSLQVTYK